MADGQEATTSAAGRDEAQRRKTKKQSRLNIIDGGDSEDESPAKVKDNWQVSDDQNVRLQKKADT
jgi:hypothetical protein